MCVVLCLVCFHPREGRVHHILCALLVSGFFFPLVFCWAFFVRPTTSVYSALTFVELCAPRLAARPALPPSPPSPTRPFSIPALALLCRAFASSPGASPQDIRLCSASARLPISPPDFYSLGLTSSFFVTP
ncbi:unnamed protein product, partial [Discosporangium mesarthrocarpum]